MVTILEDSLLYEFINTISNTHHKISFWCVYYFANDDKVEDLHCCLVHNARARLSNRCGIYSIKSRIPLTILEMNLVYGLDLIEL